MTKANPNKPYIMQIETNGKDLSALLDLYNREIDKLKSKLLSGSSWEELSTTRKNITGLAIAIHRSHHYDVNSAVDEQKHDPPVTAAP